MGLEIAVEVAALLRPGAVPGQRVRWAPLGLVQREYPAPPAEAAAFGSASAAGAAAWMLPRAVPVRAALAEFPRRAEVLTREEVRLSAQAREALAAA
jgi:hypothetical protein